MFRFTSILIILLAAFLSSCNESGSQPETKESTKTKADSEADAKAKARARARVAEALSEVKTESVVKKPKGILAKIIGDYFGNEDGESILLTFEADSNGKVTGTYTYKDVDSGELSGGKLFAFKALSKRRVQISYQDEGSDAPTSGTGVYTFSADFKALKAKSWEGTDISGEPGATFNCKRR
jgi:hypothetical protein